LLDKDQKIFYISFTKAETRRTKMAVFVVIQQYDGKIIGVFYKECDAINYIDQLRKDEYWNNRDARFYYEESDIS
jgi:hypothetical protein